MDANPPGGLSAKSMFLVIGVVLVSLVGGVAVLQMVFAEGGPFGQLVGVVQGTCEYKPSGEFSSNVIVNHAIAGSTTYALTQRVILPDGSKLGSLSTAEKAGVTINGVAVVDDRTVFAGDYRFVLAATIDTTTDPIPPEFGTECDSEADDLAGSPQNVELINDRRLADNPYAGMLRALIFLLPLAVIAFFIIRVVASQTIMLGGGDGKDDSHDAN